VSFADREGEVEIPQNAAEFLNRLSDYFFVLSRYINVKEGRDEIMWIPQKS
jgi:cob(I)alamin adenosyltransferase